MATAMCEKHGLRYDPSVHAGCVMCRRETAETTMAKPPATARSTPAGDRSIVPALVVSVLLWVTFGAVLFSAHQAVVKMGESMLRQGGEETAARAMTSQEQQTQQVLEELERMNEPDSGAGETAPAPPPSSLDSVPAASPARRPPPPTDRPID